MNYRRLTQRLHQLGCEFVRQAPGSHEVWWNPETKKFTVIPKHGGKDILLGTLRAILHSLGISPSNFYDNSK